MRIDFHLRIDILVCCQSRLDATRQLPHHSTWESVISMRKVYHAKGHYTLYDKPIETATPMVISNPRESSTLAFLGGLCHSGETQDDPISSAKEAYWPHESFGSLGFYSRNFVTRAVKTHEYCDLVSIEDIEPDAKVSQAGFTLHGIKVWPLKWDWDFKTS